MGACLPPGQQMTPRNAVSGRRDVVLPYAFDTNDISNTRSAFAGRTSPTKKPTRSTGFGRKAERVAKMMSVGRHPRMSRDASGRHPHLASHHPERLAAPGIGLSICLARFVDCFPPANATWSSSEDVAAGYRHPDHAARPLAGCKAQAP